MYKSYPHKMQHDDPHTIIPIIRAVPDNLNKGVIHRGVLEVTKMKMHVDNNLIVKILPHI